MKIEDLKILAKFIAVNVIEFRGHLLITDECGEVDLDDLTFFNPNHDRMQFALIWSKLSQTERKEVENYWRNSFDNFLTFTDTVIEDLPSVCKSTIQVIKNIS